MVEFIQELITTIFGNYVWIGIIILAMIPVTELRVALPFAMSSAWGSKKLLWWQAYICAVVGSTIPAFVIIPLLLPVFAWMKKTKWFAKLANAFDERFTGKSKNIGEKVKSENDLRKAEKIKFWGVVAFVGIPLPLTGAWTGSAVAAYLKMHWLKGVCAVFLGNLISGLIMLTFCLLFPNAVDMITYVFLGLIAIVFIVGIVLHFVKKKKNKSEEVVEKEPNNEVIANKTKNEEVVINAIYDESKFEEKEVEEEKLKEESAEETLVGESVGAEASESEEIETKNTEKSN